MNQPNKTEFGERKKANKRTYISTSIGSLARNATRTHLALQCGLWEGAKGAASKLLLHQTIESDLNYIYHQLASNKILLLATLTGVVHVSSSCRVTLATVCFSFAIEVLRQRSDVCGPDAAAAANQRSTFIRPTGRKLDQLFWGKVAFRPLRPRRRRPVVRVASHWA